MTAAIRTLMLQWYIPKCAARHIVVSTHIDNKASSRVFEKNGFVVTRTADKIRQMSESKGGQWFGMNVLEWRLEELHGEK